MSGWGSLQGAPDRSPQQELKGPSEPEVTLVATQVAYKAQLLAPWANDSEAALLWLFSSGQEPGPVSGLGS